ncbi:MAG TPA: T9SS type A sorting domain-containing protein [Bacteroidia bacterium]|nr:T9SS type A sorting domain-containing protein [Bacteroidia bacterium]
MKKVLLSLFAVFAVGTIMAQSIPNGGFEAWNITKWQNPTGYTSSNDQSNGGNSSSTLPANVLKTTDAYHGKYAERMTCITVGPDTIAGYAVQGQPNGGSSGFTLQGGIPYNQKPKGIRLFYKYTVQKTDSALILIIFKRHDTVIGTYMWHVGDTTSTYKLFSANLNPPLASTPDSMGFGTATSYLVVNNGRGMPGSVLTIDSVTFTGVTSQPTAMNGDFENWQTDSALGLTNWEISGEGSAQQTTDAKSGNFALQLTTIASQGGNNNAGQADDGITIQTAPHRDSTTAGYPFTNKIDTLEFDYKYVPADTADRANINLNLKKNSVMIWGTGTQLKASAAYKHVKMPVNSFTTPDTALVSFQSSQYVYDTALGYSTIPNSYVGAVFKIDNLQFTSQAVTVIPTAPTLSTSVINTTCGLNNGIAIVKVTGGTPPYSFNWNSTPIQTDDTASDLSPGQYTVTVKDKNYTQTAVVTIAPSSGPGLTLSVNPSSCGNHNGGASAIVSGGVSPYTYSWSTGASVSSISAISAGVYSVTITDKGGCTETASADVSDNDGPGVVVTSVGIDNCIAGIKGYILTNDTGGSGPGTYSFLWSDGETTQNATNLSGGNYNVTVTDNGGCIGAATVNVPVVLPAGVQICIVTVDSNEHNNVMWAKTGERRIDHFNIYREGSVAGVYNLVGSQPYDSLSLWVDNSAKPLTRSYRYEISEVDSCGNESALSPEHKTIHLTVNVGLPAGTYNMIWDNYEGLTFFTYYILRDTVITDYTVIDSVPNNGSQTYSDYYPTTQNIYYRIAIDNPDPCNPTYHAKSYNASHSNTATVVNLVTSVPAATKVNSVHVYPNPVKNLFYVDATGISSIQMITVLDMTGRAVEVRSYAAGLKSTTESFDMSGYAQGIYLVKINTSNGVFYQKISKVN